MMRGPKRCLRDAATTSWHLHSFARKGELLQSKVADMANGSDWDKFLDACHLLQETNIAFNPSFAPQAIKTLRVF